MFGYASSEAEEFMPSAISSSRRLCDVIYKYAKENPNQLGVDIKTQVTVDYGTKENFIHAKPQKIHTIVASAPSQRDMKIDEVRELILSLIKETAFPEKLFNIDDCIIHINPTGRYVNHSSLHDSGLTGRKLIVDTFGGYAPIGGGAQSSKDYTKVDRSGLYAARWIAKHIVASGIAQKALVQISYAIGVARPTSVSIDTQNTNLIDISDEELSELIGKRYSLTPKWITDKFGLDKPGEKFTYADVASRGQVGMGDYPWEDLDDLAWYESLKN
jgi:S-adenosylmethionine synthetase